MVMQQVMQMVMVVQMTILTIMQQQTSQKRDGNITFTGATRFMSGRRASEDPIVYLQINKVLRLGPR